MKAASRYSILIQLGLMSMALAMTLSAEETAPTARLRMVEPASVNAGEVAPAPKSEQVPAAAGDGEIAPVATECEGAGCDHQPAGGPGQSSGVIAPVYAPSHEVKLQLALNASRDEAILSFSSAVPGAAGDATYRVEGTSDLAAEAWSSVWEGSASEVDADGGVSMPIPLQGGARFFRVMVLLAE
ncbi:MAG: hypothetical protein R3F19_28050 [Verrucomicrobiales bacterium]|nr:hypothetical protein [Verrucomicrobiae bacterium]